ncbi:MAG: phosphate transport system ATP-binding protein [Thermoproteota archaeon]|nr:phosphate transport system ATP-binding protein [Thermoproteota archaeon]
MTVILNNNQDLEKPSLINKTQYWNDDSAEARNMSVKIETKGLSIFFGEVRAVKNVSIRIASNRVTAIMGPSGCGKSTLLKSFNRMNELVLNSRIEGEVLVDGNNVYAKDYDAIELRKKAGMIFQKPNPFPKSIYDNIAYGPRIHGIHNKIELDKIVEENLKKAALWNEVSDRLNTSAMDLSGGQQQRLCIARALSVEPEVILMDEPCSALDPISTSRIEELMRDLVEEYTVIIVTHNMQQSARVSDFVAFMYLGELIEYGPTRQVFEKPLNKLTENYLTGRFG